MPSLEILVPSGHRMKVSVTPVTTLSAVLQQVCEKYKYNKEDYYLRHERRTLDLSLQFRFSNLINLSKLELVAKENFQAPKTVTYTSLPLNVEWENGRAHVEMSGDQTLWDVICALPLQGRTEDLMMSGLQPVMKYGNTKITGITQLKDSSLESLGIEKDTKLTLSFESILSRKEKEGQTLGETLGISLEPSYNSLALNNISCAPTPITQAESQPKTLGDMFGISLELGQDSDTPQISNMEFHFPETPSSTIDLQQNQIKDIEHVKPENISNNERQVLVIKSESTAKFSKEDMEVDDAVYDLTEADAISLMRGYKSVNDQPLLTNELREKYEQQRYERYQKCVIRFCFSKSNYSIQAVFNPTEKVDALYDFICNYFLELQKSQCQMFITPPKKIFSSSDMKKSLLQAKLVPKSRVYVSLSDNVIDSAMEKLSKIHDEQDVDVADSMREQINSINGGSIEAKVDSTPQQKPSSSSKAQPQSATRKVPKWFKKQ